MHRQFVFPLVALSFVTAACTMNMPAQAAPLNSPNPTPVAGLPLSTNTSYPTRTETDPAITTNTDTCTPTRTFTATPTPTATATNTATLRPAHTPWAFVSLPEGSDKGTWLTLTPRGTVIRFVKRDEILILLPDEAVTADDGQAWVRVEVYATGEQGWINQRAVMTPRQVPGCHVDAPEMIAALHSGELGEFFEDYFDYSAGSKKVGNTVYIEPLFSSGVFEARSYTIPDGKTARVEIVWAYTGRQGFAIPIAIGAAFSDGETLVFRNVGSDEGNGPLVPPESYVNNPEYPALIENFKKLLYRGRSFVAAFGVFADQQGARWDRCSSPIENRVVPE